MNLTITPKITNNYPAQNARNNNQNQNFGAFKVLVYDHPEERYPILDRDKATTVFLARMEDVAAGRRVNTTQLSDKGYAVEVTPKFRGSSKARVSLVDKAHDVVTYGRGQKPVTISISSAPLKERPFGVAIKAAETFVDMLERAGLGIKPTSASKAKRSSQAGKLGRAAAKLGKRFGK